MNRTDRMIRRFDFNVRSIETDDGSEEMWVEGYAAVFDSPTVLFEMAGTEYREQICSGAFDDCQMDDVIFNYNHSGHVFARTRNKTLQLTIDDRGLLVRARLDGTEEGRNMYAEIKGGYIDRMSFSFTIREESFDSTNNQWNIRGIKRLYDVSAVDIPAYDDTSINARKDQLAEADARRRDQAADAAIALLKLKLI